MKRFIQDKTFKLWIVLKKVKQFAKFTKARLAGKRRKLYCQLMSQRFSYKEYVQYKVEEDVF